MFGAARPRHGRGDHPERRVQRPLRGAARRARPARRPPVRVDPGASSAAGRAGVAGRYGYGVEFTPGRRRRPRGRPADPDGRLHPHRRPPGRSDPRRHHPDATGRLAEARPPHASPTCPWWCWSASPAPASPPSPAGTSSPPQVALLRRLPRAWSPTTRTTSRATADAFDVLHYIAGKRLRGRPADRRRRHQRAAARPRGAGRSSPASTTCCRSRSCSTCRRSVCAGAQRRARRPGRTCRAGVIQRQQPRPAPLAARPGARGLPQGARPARRRGGRGRRDRRYERLFNDLRDLTGPFDIIGDVHGCRAELETLLLGSARRWTATTRAGRSTPRTRTAVPRSSSATWSTAARTRPGVLRLVMGMVGGGHALCVPGNHENKLLRQLRGRKVQLTHGLAETIEQLAAEDRRRSAREVRGVHRRPGQPLRAGRRAGWSSATPG